MGTRAVTIDRAKTSADSLAEVIVDHLGKGDSVHVTDSDWPAGERLRHTVQQNGGAAHLSDGHGRRLGVFADLDALVAHAERMTA